MRYALRNQAKIASATSERFLTDILESLSGYFGSKTDDQILLDLKPEGFYHEKYKILRIPDLSDCTNQLDFALIGKTYDVLRLAFVGKIGNTK